MRYLWVFVFYLCLINNAYSAAFSQAYSLCQSELPAWKSTHPGQNPICDLWEQGNYKYVCIFETNTWVRQPSCFGFESMCIYSTSTFNYALKACTKTCPDGSLIREDYNCSVSCTLPAIFDPVTNTCQTATCILPQTLSQITGLCEIKECTSTTWFNNSTGQCDSIPDCASNTRFKVYDSSTNTCKLDQNECASTEHISTDGLSCVLNDVPCPHANTHYNSAANTCDPDPPLGCPIGQHDDGTYTCVADDPVGCTHGEIHGYINGVVQCIPRPKTPEQQLADTAVTNAQQTVNDAQQAVADAQAAADDANQAAANDPTNTVLSDQADAANKALSDAQDDLAKAENDLADAQQHKDLEGVAKESTLQEVSEILTDIRDGSTHSVTGNGNSCLAPPSCDGDPIQCAILRSNFEQTCHGDDATQELADSLLGTTSDDAEDVTLSVIDSSGLGIARSCPDIHSYSVMSTFLVIDVSPFCDLAEIIGKLLLITSSFIGLRILASD